MYECFACKYIYVPWVCLVPVKVRRDYYIPLNCSYRKF